MNSKSATAARIVLIVLIRNDAATVPYMPARIITYVKSAVCCVDNVQAVQAEQHLVTNP